MEPKGKRLTKEDAIMAVLLKIAESEDRHPINYACLSDTMYLNFKDHFEGKRPSHRHLGRDLGHIVTRCKNAGLPCLPTLVINVESRIPGDGFYEALYNEPTARDFGRKLKIEIAREQRQMCYEPQPWYELIKRPIADGLLDASSIAAIKLDEKYFTDQRLRRLNK